jgi:uncharacterized sulfatase
MADLTRRAFLHTAASAAVLSSISGGAASSPSRPKNVLFIGVDDQNTRLRCYGNTVVQTPNLDAFASRGVRFASAYCQYPLCGPSRASLMTSLSPDVTKVYDLRTNFRTALPNAVTLGQLFRKNGYFSARVGKIYHQNVPTDIGTSGQDDPQTWDYIFNPNGVDHTQEEPDVTNYTPSKVRGTTPEGEPRIGSSICFYESGAPDEAMTDSLGADQVIRLLRQKRKQPFFLAYGLYRPHVPWIVPKAYFDRYPLEKIEATPLVEGEMRQAPAVAYTSHTTNLGMNSLECRKAIRAYYASSTFMDAQVGRVLRELRLLGLEDDTLVVFWADHGWSLGEHGQWQKQTVFESATHVPLILAGPGVAKGAVCGRTVEHLDIYPTLAELLALQHTPEKLHGKSLVPLLRDADAPWESAAVSQVVRRAGPDETFGYSLRTERYRYTSWQGKQIGEELYDYDTDPRESRNIARDPRYKSIKGSLKSELARITESRGRSMVLQGEQPAGQPG